MKIHALFQSQEQLNNALYNLEQEFPGLSNQAFQVNQVSRGHHLTTMWETMGASTGTFLGRMIGLGVQTSILMTNALLVTPLEDLQQLGGQEKTRGVRVEVE
ncbi:MAG: hypothetical protein ACYDG6_02580 [Thermincolia bacterium]